MTIVGNPASEYRREELLESTSDLVGQVAKYCISTRYGNDHKTSQWKTDNPRGANHIDFLMLQLAPDVMRVFGTYSTGALEELAAILADAKREADHLYMWRTYDGPEWNSVAGENREGMFRDVLALRRYAWSQGWSSVHSLLDTYQAFGLDRGSIHLMSPDEIRSNIVPAFQTASSSRSVLWLRVGPAERRMDSNREYILPVERAVPDEYRQTHLSESTVKYVKNVEDGKDKLRKYMFEKKQTLREMDFDHFLAWVDSHSSLTDGVL